MKKMILLSVVVLLLLIPSTSAAIELPPMTVTIAGNGLSFTITVPETHITIYYTVTFCDGTMLKDAIHPLNETETIVVNKPISHVVAVSQDEYHEWKAQDSRSCEAADPLFMMWLLMRGDQGCILLSEAHPSVERQRALCFPATDPDWTADSAPCADYVYSNDTWSCDAFGFSRLPLHSETGPDLMEVWQRHKGRQQD